MLIISRTTAWTEFRAAFLRIRFCSRIETGPLLFINSSEPSGRYIKGCVPVVFASTDRWSSLRIEAIIRTTLDFPRAPVTAILNGILFTKPLNAAFSRYKYTQNSAKVPAVTTIPLMVTSYSSNLRAETLYSKQPQLANRLPRMKAEWD
jgi:hypothetical protein